MASLMPALPVELERAIFEICALSRPTSIPKLMLVASCAKEWVEPVLYRTIAVSSLRHTTDDYLVLPQQFLLRTMRTKPPKFFHNNVRHLFLGACPTGIVSSVLTVCTHVENLSIDINLGADDIRLIASFPLQHLYTVFEPFLRALPPTHGLFSQLTHLDIVDKPDPLPSPDAMGRWVTLSLMPRLTHLSFRNHRFIRICGRLLETCESLSVLVSMSTSGIEHADRPILNDLERYPRFVVLRCNDFFDDWNFGIRLGLLGASGKGHRETSTGGNQLNCSVHSTSIP
ncbi:hypothetical protein FB451DRAFT_1096106 [Mycena latifolia]|nr:hypothetical protein FB451DRAFT_1096106 [Mycena latifolia]